MIFSITLYDYGYYLWQKIVWSYWRILGSYFFGG